LVEREVSERFSRAARRHNALELVWCALLVVIGAAAFGTGLSSHLTSDDWRLVSWTQPEGMRTAARWFSLEIARAWGFRPVVLAASTAVQIAGGARAAHVVSFGLLLLASMLVFLEVRAHAWSDPAARRRTDRLWPAALASLFFLVHPRNDEAAFWFSAVAYPLAATFGLLYFRLLDGRSALSRVGAFVCLAAALLSHPAAAAFPLAVAARSLLVRREGRPGRDSLVAAATLAFLAVSLSLGPAAAGDAAHPRILESVKSAADLAASTAWPFGPGVASLVVLAGLAVYGLWAAPGRDAIAIQGLVLLAVPSVLSALAFPGVLAPRFHLLPAIGVAFLLSSAWGRAGFWKIPSVLLAVFVAVRGVGENARRADAWSRAGALGDEVFEKLLQAAPPSGDVVLLGAPESLDGAWVYRHGLVERVRMQRPGLGVRHVKSWEDRPEPASLAGRTVLIWTGSEWARPPFGPPAPTAR